MADVGPPPLRYLQEAPAPPLRRFVRCVWALESRPGAPTPPEDLVLPDGCVEAVLDHGDGFERVRGPGGPGAGTTGLGGGAELVGQIATGLRLRPLGRVGVVGVRFEPAGAALLLGLRADEATGRTVPLSDVGPPARALVAAVAEAGGSLPARMRAAQAALLPLARAAPSRRTLAERVVDGVQRAGGRARLDDLCRDLGEAGRRVERHVRDAVGIPPKLLARIVRFQDVLRRLRARGTRSLAAVALDAGYCDQSHLTRDFVEFAGEPPTRWLAKEHALASAFLS